MGVSNIFNGDCVLDDDKVHSRRATSRFRPPVSQKNRSDMPYGRCLVNIMHACKMTMRSEWLFLVCTDTFIAFICTTTVPYNEAATNQLDTAKDTQQTLTYPKPIRPIADSSCPPHSRNSGRYPQQSINIKLNTTPGTISFTKLCRQSKQS